MEQSIKEMENAIVAKDAYVQIVQTRLHLHNQRQNVENCRDPPQKAYVFYANYWPGRKSHSSIA